MDDRNASSSRMPRGIAQPCPVVARAVRVAAIFTVLLGLAVAWAGGQARATTLRFSFQGDLNSLDPYTLNETFTLGLLGNVMEGLTARDKDLKIIPCLAERWEVLDPLRWRFHLRRGVKFHNGAMFTADDVLFSLERMRSEGSQLKRRVPPDAQAVKIDDYTVDFVLKQPNPILIAEWDTWYMFSKSWAMSVGAQKAQSASAATLSSWALMANGTGPFLIESHEPGVRTVFKRNPDWWQQPEHNLDEAVFTTIKSDATRVAALLSGDVDLIDPVPVQDMPRVATGATTMLLTGPELRTMFLNLDSLREELGHGDVKGRNPFKDARVRKAIYQAIDIEAIKSKVMRGQAVPTALPISPKIFAPAAEFRRYPYDVAAARRLMAQAGYSDGFSVRLDCTNDRYVNDDEICTAIAAMLAQIKINVAVNAVPKARFFAFTGASGGYDSSFNLLGYTPASLDALSILTNVVGCRAGGAGMFNFGGYCNPRLDALAARAAVEGDGKARDAMMRDAFRLLHEDVGIVPLHQQMLAWGVSRSLTITQRADNQILFYWANKR